MLIISYVKITLLPSLLPMFASASVMCFLKQPSEAKNRTANILLPVLPVVIHCVYVTLQNTKSELGDADRGFYNFHLFGLASSTYYH